MGKNLQLKVLIAVMLALTSFSKLFLTFSLLIMAWLSDHCGKIVVGVARLF
jgi:hypothetical protein